MAQLVLHALNEPARLFLLEARVTEEGVDLNRNFPDFSQPLPPNDADDEQAALLRSTWLPAADNEAGLFVYAARLGDLAWIDLHTGLAPCGHGEKILACREDAAPANGHAAGGAMESHPFTTTPPAPPC